MDAVLLIVVLAVPLVMSLMVIDWLSVRGAAWATDEALEVVTGACWDRPRGAAAPVRSEREHPAPRPAPSAAAAPAGQIAPAPNSAA